MLLSQLLRRHLPQFCNARRANYFHNSKRHANLLPEPVSQLNAHQRIHAHICQRYRQVRLFVPTHHEIKQRSANLCGQEAGRGLGLEQLRRLAARSQELPEAAVGVSGSCGDVVRPATQCCGIRAGVGSSSTRCGSWVRAVAVWSAGRG